ncbi:MAG TPA: tetratricopeptide repeat protein [Kiritimatiellia bacterium]
MMKSTVLFCVIAAAVATSGCRSKNPKIVSVVKPPPAAAATSAPPAAVKPFVPPAIPAPAPAPVVAAPAATSRPPAQALSTLAQAKAAEVTAKEEQTRMKTIEKTLAERRAEQERVARQLEDLKKQIMDSAQSLRDLKVRTDNLSAVQATNALAIAALDQQLASIQKPPAKAMQELQGALDREKAEKNKAAAQLAEKSRELDALKKQQTAAIAKPAPAPAPAPVAAPPAAVPAKPAAPAAATEVPVTAYKLVADGNQFLRSGKLTEAEQSFQQALTQAPGLTGAKVGLAACRYNAGQLDDALRLAGEVLGVDKKNAQALGVRGIALWQQGKLRDANQALTDAVRYDPSDSQLHNYLGVVLQARDEFDGAVREVRKAVELDAANAEARYNLAVLLATSRRPAMYEARVHYEAAVQMGNPRDAAMDKLLYGTATP